MTMQFVVGATPDTDRTLIETVARLQAGGGIHHAHFSAFRPIARHADGARARGAGAARAPAVSGGLPAARLRLRRRTRWCSSADGQSAALDVDPKTAWALAHPERFPVEVTRADYETLLRVPGIGPVAARRLVAERPALRSAGSRTCGGSAW